MTGGVLKPGDRVLWRGAWGSEPEQVATVRAIEHLKPGQRDGGEALPFVPWVMLGVGRRIVVDLDNGRWAYGYQIAPLPSEAA